MNDTIIEWPAPQQLFTNAQAIEAAWDALATVMAELEDAGEQLPTESEIRKAATQLTNRYLLDYVRPNLDQIEAIARSM